MLSFPSQNEKKMFFPPAGVYPKQHTRVTTKQHIFKSGLALFTLKF